MKTTKTQAAEKIHDQMLSNIDAYYKETLTHEQFSQAQRLLWDAAQREGIKDKVTDMIRQTLY